MNLNIITVRQPWASAMFRPVAPKDIENRVWPTNLRERIGIHAGQGVDPVGVAAIGMSHAAERDRGVILGTVEITGCHEAGSKQCEWHKCADNPWAQWPSAQHPTIFHWELEHPREFSAPIRAKGALRFWQPSEVVAHLLTLEGVG